MNATPSTPPSGALTQTLASYLPRYQLRLIAEGLRSGDEPLVENRSGAILLVDVSGFTALTERFAAQGAAGAETLSGILNRYFGRIADLIAASGGDIIAFAGDSAIAMWPGEESELATNVLRATQAALNIQAELDGYEPVPGTPLRQRAGVGCGTLQLMQLGGVSGRWHFVVTGTPITQASVANQQAQPGEVILSSETWDLAKNNLRGDLLPSGLARTTKTTALDLPSVPLAAAPSSDTLESLSPYVPAVVADRLRAGQERWIAEFRTLSMLFLNLAGPETNASISVAPLHQNLRCIQEVLLRFEGTLYQFLMDDKGLTAVCAFGLPPLAHENDPRRALEAGIALQEALACQDVSTSVGIATGPVFCGVYGSANRRQYTTLGNTVNLSARLMQAAENSILCDEATLRAAGSSTLHFEPKGEIKVKGRSALIPVFAPIGQSDAASTGYSIAPSHSHLMVGRDAERAALADALAALDREESRCIVIEGEAGVGKSCLIEQLSQQVDEANRPVRKITCWRAAADSIQQSTPYHVWRAVFREALQLNGVPVADQGNHVLAQLESRPDLLALAPLLNVVIPLGIAENSTTSAMAGEARAENTQHLLIGILQLATARSKTAIILEDAHWFDSSSLRLALLAAQQVSPLLLTISTRPIAEPAPAEFTALVALPSSHHLVLGALESELALLMVCQSLGVSHLPPEVARLIQERAAGHPLFSQQLAYALRDAGLIIIADSRCQIAEAAAGAAFGAALTAMRFPSSVEGVITSRLDRLPTAEQLTVKVASVLGQRFALAALSEIFPVGTARTELSTHLAEMEKLDLIQRSDSPDPAYAFKHAIIQDVAYNCIPFAQRRELHRSAAEWYEMEFCDNLPSQYALLAHHWSRAEVAPKAVYYCSEAGSQALRNHANPEAVRFLSEALRLDESAVDQNEHREISTPQSAARPAEWELQLGKAYVNWSKYVEGRPHLERGLSLQRQKIPSGSVSAAAALFTEIARQCVHRALPNFYLGHRAREREALLKYSSTFADLTEIYFHQNDALRTLHAVFRCLNLAEVAGPSPELGRGYSFVGSLVGFLPLHGAANAYFGRASRVASEIDDPATRVWVTISRTAYYIGVGRWNEAAQLASEAKLISDRMGDHRRSDDLSTIALLVQILQGKFRDSLELANSLYNSAKERLNIRIQSEALYGKGWSLLLLNRLEELKACVDELDSLRSAQLKIGGRHQKQDVYCLYGLLHLATGDFPEAKQAIDRAVQALTRNSFYNDILVHSAISEVYLALWQTARIGEPSLPELDVHQLEDAVRQSHKALRRYCRVFPIGKPLLYLRQGQYEWIKGNRPQAVKLWQQSLKAAIDLRADYYQGLAHLELALHLDSANPACVSHGRQAREILTRLGAARDLSRLPSSPDSELLAG